MFKRSPLNDGTQGYRFSWGLTRKRVAKKKYGITKRTGYGRDHITGNVRFISNVNPCGTALELCGLTRPSGRAIMLARFNVLTCRGQKPEAADPEVKDAI